jgi:Mg-chelatase subunit ChlD
LLIVLYIPGKLKPGGPSPLAAGLLMALSGITQNSTKQQNKEKHKLLIDS